MMSFESGYYPAGAEHDSNAPYNEHENEEEEVNVTISSSLSKSTTVFTSDYDVEEWKDYDTNDEGGYIYYGGRDVTYDNVNFKKEYDDQHMTPLELIEKFKDFLESHMPDRENVKEYCMYKYLLEECQGWTEDELEVIPD